MDENRKVIGYDPQTGQPQYSSNLNNIQSQNNISMQNNINENRKVMGYDPQTGQPQYSSNLNNVQSQNNISMQNNINENRKIMGYDPQTGQPQYSSNLNNVQPQNNISMQNNINENRKVIGYDPQTGQPQYSSNLNNIQSSNTTKSKKINKKILIIVIAIIMVLIILGLSFAIFGGESSSKSRTFMIYMIGSDLESEGGMATVDVNEIKKSGIDLKDNNVIIYAGGASNWYNDFENNSIYELTETGFVLVNSQSKASMGEASTLTNFLNYSTDNYDSDTYSLILWDHGSGPILGYGIDEVHKNDNLFMEELDIALKNSKFSSSNKLEFIGFDACLMASAEIASVVSEYTDYMVASQDIEPGFGWDYAFLKEANKGVSTVDLAKHIIDYNDSYYEKLEIDYGGTATFYTTLSLLDLTKIKNLEDKLNILFKGVDGTLLNNGYSRIVNKITRAKSFGYAGYEQSYDLLDLMGVSEQLMIEYSDEANDLKKAIEDVVVYQKTNVEGANGISIYYPYYTKSYLNQFLQVYDTLDFAEDYTNFLGRYSKILSGQKLYDYSLTSRMPVLSENKDNISVNLENEIVNSYNKADYVIFRDMKDGYYMPVYKSSDVSLENNILSANFNKKQLSVVDAEGEAGWATMYEYERNNSYVLYNVPAVIIKTKDKYESKSVYIQLRVDSDNPNGTIIGVIPAIDVEDISSMKQLIKLEDWDYIQFFNSEYDFYDDNGIYTEDWKSSGTVYLTEVSLEKGYEISFINLEEEYDYYCMFQVHDTQGNVHYTNLVKVD